MRQLSKSGRFKSAEARETLTTCKGQDANEKLIDRPASPSGPKRKKAPTSRS